MPRRGSRCDASPRGPRITASPRARAARDRGREEPASARSRGWRRPGRPTSGTATALPAARAWTTRRARVPRRSGAGDRSEAVATRSITRGGAWRACAGRGRGPELLPGGLAAQDALSDLPPAGAALQPAPLPVGPARLAEAVGHERPILAPGRPALPAEGPPDLGPRLPGSRDASQHRPVPGPPRPGQHRGLPDQADPDGSEGDIPGPPEAVGILFDHDGLVAISTAYATTSPAPVHSP
jgi:hypothetical protein